MSPHTLKDNDDDGDDYKSRCPRTPWNMIIMIIRRVPALLLYINMSMILMILVEVPKHLVKDILEASLSGLATAVHLSRND